MKRYSRLILISTAVIALLSFLGATSTCRAYFGEIIKNLGSMYSTDAGGLTFKPDDPDHFYEAWRKRNTIWKRRVSDGAVVEEIPIYWKYPHVSAGIMGMSWDLNRRVFWISDAYGAAAGTTIATLPETGGYATARFNLSHSSGLDYYEPADELWVANALYNKIYHYNTAGQLMGTFVPALADPQGVLRIGDKVWVTDWEKSSNYITQYEMDGVPTGLNILISGRPGLDSNAAALDLAFDGQYLWCLTCNPCRVLQIDIGYATPSPAPSPTPIPVEMPVIDSGDYNGDGTSDIAIFRAAAGLWAVRGITQTYFGRNNDIPVPGDYNGDGITDIGIYREGNSLWAIKDITRAYFGGGTGLTPVPGDYNGDGLCDIALFKESSGLWAIRGQTRMYFGAQGDLPVPGYFTGSRRKDIAVFRPSTGLWSIKNVTRTFFGQAGDIPIAADYNNDRRADIAIYRSSTRLWAVKDQTRVYYGGAAWNQPQPGDYNGSGWCNFGIFQDSPGLWKVRGVTRVYYGKSGDIPVSAPIPISASWNPPAIDSGDYNGDGTSEIAIFRDSAGLWAIRGVTQTFFGERGDIPVSGDYNGDGTTDIGIYRPSSRLWVVRGFTRFYFGNSSSYLPIPGDYNGDGRCDYGIFNTNTGFWQIRIQLWALFISEFYFGTKGDIPVPGYYSHKAVKRAAYFRPSTGRWAIRGWSRFYFGQPQDTPIIGDYNGDGISDIGIYRQSERLWAIRNITRAYYGGFTGNRPVPADYRGNGTAELGIFRENPGTWAIRRLTRVYFGTIGDTPVVR